MGGEREGEKLTGLYAGNRFVISGLYNFNNGINGINDRLSIAHQPDLSHETNRMSQQRANQQGCLMKPILFLFFFNLMWESRDILSLAIVPGILQYSDVFCHVGN